MWSNSSSVQGGRSMDVKIPKKDKYRTAIGWTRPFNRAGRLIQLKNTVFSWAKNRDFENWLLKRGWPLNCLIQGRYIQVRLYFFSRKKCIIFSFYFCENLLLEKAYMNLLNSIFCNGGQKVLGHWWSATNYLSYNWNSKKLCYGFQNALLLPCSPHPIQC